MGALLTVTFIFLCGDLCNALEKWEEEIFGGGLSQTVVSEKSQLHPSTSIEDLVALQQREQNLAKFLADQLLQSKGSATVPVR